MYVRELTSGQLAKGLYWSQAGQIPLNRVSYVTSYNLYIQCTLVSVKAVSRCICYFCGFIVIYSLYLFFPNGAEIITLIIIYIIIYIPIIRESLARVAIMSLALRRSAII